MRRLPVVCIMSDTNCLPFLSYFYVVSVMPEGTFAAAPVRVESLQVIGAMATCHFASAIAPNVTVLQSALEVALKDTDESIRLHAARAVESIGLAMHKSLEGKFLTC